MYLDKWSKGLLDCPPSNEETRALQHPSPIPSHSEEPLGNGVRSFYILYKFVNLLLPISGGGGDVEMVIVCDSWD